MQLRLRDAFVASVAAAVTWSGVALAGDKPTLGPRVWDWAALPAKATDVGQLRDVVRQPTATLDELEMHVTTLKPGLSSHPPHKHPNEELVIIKEGVVEVLSGGVWKQAGPGSIIFNASNSPHALRNVGNSDTTYHVINWRTPATPQA